MFTSKMKLFQGKRNFAVPVDSKKNEYGADTWRCFA